MSRTPLIAQKIKLFGHPDSPYGMTVDLKVEAVSGEKVKTTTKKTIDEFYAVDVRLTVKGVHADMNDLHKSFAADTEAGKYLRRRGQNFTDVELDHIYQAVDHFRNQRLNPGTELQENAIADFLADPGAEVALMEFAKREAGNALVKPTSAGATPRISVSVRSRFPDPHVLDNMGNQNFGNLKPDAAQMILLAGYRAMDEQVKKDSGNTKRLGSTFEFFVQKFMQNHSSTVAVVQKALADHIGTAAKSMLADPYSKRCMILKSVGALVDGDYKYGSAWLCKEYDKNEIVDLLKLLKVDPAPLQKHSFNPSPDAAAASSDEVNERRAPEESDSENAAPRSEEALLKWLKRYGIDHVDLYDIVYDVAQKKGLGQLNSLPDAGDQNDHISAVERAASAINNEGMEAQVKFLANAYSNDLMALKHLLVHKLEIGYPPSDTYNISVTYEIVTAESAEDGEAQESGFEHEKIDVDADELKRYAQDLGISEPSDSICSSRTWFSSTQPVEDRNYFEKGEHKTYSLHINSVNGKKPEVEDIQRVAELIDVKFSHSHASPRP